MIWTIHLHDYVQKLLIFQGWFFVSWKILGLEIAPQLVGKVHHPWRPLPLPNITALDWKGIFLHLFRWCRNFGMDFFGWRNVVVCFEMFLSCQSWNKGQCSSCSKYRVISCLFFIYVLDLLARIWREPCCVSVHSTDQFLVSTTFSGSCV